MRNGSISADMAASYTARTCGLNIQSSCGQAQCRGARRKAPRAGRQRIKYSEARLRSESACAPVWPHAFATAHETKAVCMSRRNGDRARFQKERKRKMLRRQRVQEFLKAEQPDAAKPAAAPAA